MLATTTKQFDLSKVDMICRFWIAIRKEIIISFRKGVSDLNNINHIYGAYVFFPKSEGEIIFRYHKIHIKKRYTNVIELYNPYFVCRENSTHFFDETNMNKELEITKDLSVFYSESKDKCVEWLENCRKNFLASYRCNLMRLEQSKILEIID